MNNVVERANSMYQVKSQENVTGFAIMESRNTMRWKQGIRILAMIGVGEMNSKAVMKEGW